jgi:hypothetical protein
MIGLEGQALVATRHLVYERSQYLQEQWEGIHGISGTASTSADLIISRNSIQALPCLSCSPLNTWPLPSLMSGRLSHARYQNVDRVNADFIHQSSR